MDRLGRDEITRALQSLASELGTPAQQFEVAIVGGGRSAPEWTHDVPELAEPFLLVRAAATMPRLRHLCETEGPEPLRRRRLLAPPEFLTAA